MIKVDELDEIIEKHSSLGLIALLEAIQSRYGYLPEEALRRVSESTKHSLVEIYSVATFYKSFSLNPRGKHLISVCLGTACHVRSAPMIAEEFERQLNVKAGKTTTDKEFTLETVNCLGACALGPIVSVDGHIFSNVKTSRVKSIITLARNGIDQTDVSKDEKVFAVNVNCPKCNHSLEDDKHLIDGKPSVRFTMSFERKHGWICLSQLYGSYNIKSEYEIPIDSVVNFFCPHCHAELTNGTSCTECNAPMVPMIVKHGGMVQVCSRMGCKNHMLDLNGENF